MAVIENDVLMKYKDSSGNVNLLYPITRADDVDGLQEAIRNQGVVTEGTGAVYTATVEGVASLSAGVSFVMIPHTVSTSSSAKLNVNNLGEKFIRRRVSGSTTTTYSAKTSDDWLAAGKPITVTYDGTQWIADMPVPYAGDFMGTLLINNGGTGATTAAQARINLGIETTDGTVSSGNADYAEVGEWIDGNPDAEDRIGYFVCIDNNTPGTTMRKATSSDDIRGVTVASPAFSGGCSFDKYAQTESPDTDADPDADSRSGLLPRYDYVAVMGIVPVIDDGTCVINGRCIPNDNGIATPAGGDYGYQVMDRIDDTHVLIAVEPGTDVQYKIANSVIHKSGDTMTGALEMSGNKITGLGSPSNDTDAANKTYVDAAKAEAKSYTDTAKAEAKSYTDSKRLVLTAVIAAENWVRNSTLYVNQVTVAGLKSSDMPHIVPSYNWESGTPYTQKEAWDKVSYAVSLDGAINFVALEDLPTTDIPIQIEVNR